MASTPAAKLNLPRISPYPPGSNGPPPQQKPVTFFTSSPSLHKSSTVSHRPTALYNSISPLATPTRPQPAAQTQNYARPRTPRQPPNPSSGAAGEVTPHLAGWMKVADEVVGRHPNAVPLRERVATQEEIELISGHVHIPWASVESAEHRPIVINLYRPPPAMPAYPDLPGPSTSLARHQKRIDRLEPGLLSEISNVHRVQNTPVANNSISKRTHAQYRKEKPATGGRVRYKENVYPSPHAGPSSQRAPRIVARI